jgi:hypothetical protein
MRQYGQPAALNPSLPTNGFAVAALVLGLLGGWLLAIIFGCVALSKIRRTGARGRGLAITGLVASGIWVVALVVIVVAVLAGGEGSPVVTAVASASAPPGTVTFERLTSGDCLQYPDDLTSVTTVQTLPCAEPHNAEVIGLYDATGVDWPGVDAIQQEANQRCGDLVKTSVDNAAVTDDMSFSFVFPNDAASWDAGDREVICLVHKATGTTTGSVRAVASPGN